MGKLKKYMVRATLWIHLYIITTFVGLLSFFMPPYGLFAFLSENFVYFTGASSVVCAFMLGVTMGSKWVAIFAIIWIFAFLISLIVSYYIALKKHETFPFFVVAGLDLVASILVIGIKTLILRDYYGISQFVVALLFRGAYYLWMQYCAKKEKRPHE